MNNRGERIRQFARRTPIFYRFTRRIKALLCWDLSGKLCRAEMKLCIEGYPSSANTFIGHFVKEVYPEIDFNNFGYSTHSITNIKMALDYRIPLFVLLRKPEDAITSRRIRFDYNLKLGLKEYIVFYKFVYEKRGKLTIIPFELITQETVKALELIEKNSDLPSKYNNIDIEKTEERVFKKMKKNYAETHEDSQRMPLPQKKREKRKKKLKKKLKELKDFKRAEELYNKLLNEFKKYEVKLNS